MIISTQPSDLAWSLVASRLLEALRPFAEKATAWEERHPQRGPYPTRDSHQIEHRLGDFRAARQAISEAEAFIKSQTTKDPT